MSFVSRFIPHHSMGQSVSIGALLPLRLRLWLGNLLFRPLGPKTFRVSWHRVIKGPCDPPEIEAMQYVASHTTIPVPRIYAIHTKNIAIYIEMAYIPGDTLSTVWDSLSTDDRDTIFADIKKYVSCLRELPPPKQDIVCSASRNPAYDCRIGFQFFGPMTHDEFHSLTRKHLLMEDVKAGVLGREVATTHTSRYRTCFTHADLAPRNIIVRHGRVAAIIDWAFAGWYPEYWEFTKAHYNFFSEDWEEYLSIALPVYKTELLAEKTLWRMLPEPGTRSGATFSDGTHFEHKGSEPSDAWLAARAGRQLTDLWSLALTPRD